MWVAHLLMHTRHAIFTCALCNAYILQCDVGARNIEGATPLHLAALAGHTQVRSSVQRAAAAAAAGAGTLRRPAVPHRVDDGPWLRSPSHCFSSSPTHTHQVVAVLARAPAAQLDAPDLQGRTALHLAAARGHGGAVTELWARGAAMDASDLHGWTALHYASRAGHSEVALQLVIAGSLVSASDPHGISAAHLAAERGFAGGCEDEEGMSRVAWDRLPWSSMCCLRGRAA